jgi:vitamin B12 transporter
MKKLFVLFGVLIFSCSLFASETAKIEEETTVTATKEEVSIKEISKKVVVVTKEEIENSGSATVLDVLKTVPGVIVSSTGSQGGVANIYLRGAKPGQTLIMIDGIEVSDPMSVDNSFDFSNLTASNIQRIEIVYGSTSVVYGSDAMAGVINIITVSKTNGSSLKIEGGSNKTKYGAFSLQNSVNNLTYWIKGNYFDTDGISSASEKYGNTEKDGYENKTAMFGINYQLCDSDLRFSGILIDTNGDLDNFGGAYGDNLTYTYERKNTYLKGSWLKKAVWGNNSKTALIFTYSKTQRDLLDPGVILGNYNGEQYKINWHNTLTVANIHNISFGVEYEKEQGDSYYKSVSDWGEFESIFDNKDISTTGIYLIDRISLANSQTIELGLRYEDNDMFGSKTTYQAGYVKNVENAGLTFRLNAGTSFKAPSLYQLFSDYGDENLKAEEGDTYEIGFDKQIFNGSTVFSATYYYYTFDNLIDFDSALFKYQNIKEAELKGFELAIRYYSKYFNCSFIYNDYKTEDKETSEPWLRRPDNSFTFNMNFNYNKFSCNLNGTYNSDRKDLDFSTWPAQAVVLDSYTVFNVKLNYKVNKNLSVYVKGRNITDEDYELVYGYGTYKDTYFGGIVFTF